MVFIGEVHKRAYQKFKLRRLLPLKRRSHWIAYRGLINYLSLKSLLDELAVHGSILTQKQACFISLILCYVLYKTDLSSNE